MGLDINATITDMLNAIKASVQSDWDNIKDSTSSFLNDHKARLEKLAIERINNEIDDDYLKDSLSDEVDILKVNLLSEKIIAESAAQNAANAAIGVLQKAIETALKL